MRTPRRRNPDTPVRWYHASPVRNRESIRSRGLLTEFDAGMGMTPVGVYFTEHAPVSSGTTDVWEADLSGYTLMHDPFCGEDAALGACVYVAHDVAPSRLRLVLPLVSRSETRRRNPDEPVRIRLVGFGKPRAIKPEVEAFLRDLFDASYPNPLGGSTPTERILSGIEVLVDVVPEHNGVHIDRLRALTRKQGEGTKAMRFLTSLADKHGVKLSLYAKPFGSEAMNRDTLVNFYRRFGFYPDEAEEEDEGTEMYRWPREPLRSNPARKAKPPTLAAAGLPEVWFHGTQKTFGKLKAQGGACIWLADKAGAMAYATPHYGRRSAIRLIEVALAPDTRVVDLADASDPAVRSFIHLDASERNMRWHGREDVTDAEMVEAVARWNARRTHYDAIEARSWAKAHFRKAGADALLVRDVAGWGGHEAMPSLCLLNPKKVLGERDVAPDLALVRAENMPKYENPRSTTPARRKVTR